MDGPEAGQTQDHLSSEINCEICIKWVHADVNDERVKRRKSASLWWKTTDHQERNAMRKSLIDKHCESLRHDRAGDTKTTG